MPENLGFLFDDRAESRRHIAPARTIIDVPVVAVRDLPSSMPHAAADFAQGRSISDVAGATLAELTGIQPLSRNLDQRIVATERARHLPDATFGFSDTARDSSRSLAWEDMPPPPIHEPPEAAPIESPADQPADEPGDDPGIVEGPSADRPPRDPNKITEVPRQPPAEPPRVPPPEVPPEEPPGIPPSETERCKCLSFEISPSPCKLIRNDDGSGEGSCVVTLNTTPFVWQLNSWRITVEDDDGNPSGLVTLGKGWQLPIDGYTKQDSTPWDAHGELICGTSVSLTVTPRMKLDGLENWQNVSSELRRAWEDAPEPEAEGECWVVGYLNGEECGRHKVRVRRRRSEVPKGPCDCDAYCLDEATGEPAEECAMDGVPSLFGTGNASRSIVVTTEGPKTEIVIWTAYSEGNYIICDPPWGMVDCGESDVFLVKPSDRAKAELEAGAPNIRDVVIVRGNDGICSTIRVLLRGRPTGLGSELMMQVGDGDKREDRPKCFCDKVPFYVSTGTEWEEQRPGDGAALIKISPDGAHHAKAYFEIHTYGQASTTYGYEILVKAGTDPNSPESDLVGFSDEHIKKINARRTPYSVWGNWKCTKPVWFPIEIQKYSESEAEAINEANAAVGVEARVKAGQFKQGVATIHVLVNDKPCALLQVMVTSNDNPCDLAAASIEARRLQHESLTRQGGIELRVPERVVIDTYRDFDQMEKEVLQRVQAAKSGGGFTEVVASDRFFAVEYTLKSQVSCEMLREEPDCCCAYIKHVSLTLETVIHSVADAPVRNPDIPAITGPANDAFWALKDKARESFLSVLPVRRLLEKSDCEVWCKSRTDDGCPSELNESISSAVGELWKEFLSSVIVNPRSAGLEESNYTIVQTIKYPSQWNTAALKDACSNIGQITLLIYDLIGVEANIIADMVKGASNILLQCCVEISDYSIDRTKRVVDDADLDWGHSNAVVKNVPGKHLVVIGPSDSVWVRDYRVLHPGAIGAGEVVSTHGKVGKIVALWDSGVSAVALAHELGHNAGLIHLGHGPTYVMNGGAEVAKPQGSSYQPMYDWTPQDCRNLQKLPGGIG